jgi:hypothetical protein
MHQIILARDHAKTMLEKLHDCLKPGEEVERGIIETLLFILGDAIGFFLLGSFYLPVFL